MTVAVSPSPAVATLARHEISRYARHKLYWLGAAITAVMVALDVTGSSDTGGESTTLAGIGPAAVLGVFGLFVMVSLTRSSDRAAASAGSVIVPESTRTLALAAAIVVPVLTALVAWAGQIVGYLAHPPTEATAGGLADLPDAYFFAVLFGQVVVAACGGPMLGLVVARWIPRRGAAAVAAVLLVVLTVVNQGLLESTRGWRVLWVWTHWYGPHGTELGDDQWVVFPGSPYLWILYLAGLCALGLLVALYHDPEADRSRLRAAIIAVAGSTLLVGVLAATAPIGGVGETTANTVAAD